MKLACLQLFLCSFAVAADQLPTVPAWRNAVDKSAAESAMAAYTSNVIRCEWAGEDPNVSRLMPANLSFQFAVMGDSDVTNRVQKILNEVADSFTPAYRQRLERLGLLNSTLHWLALSSKSAVTNWQEYLKPQNHPAVFKESDFNVAKMKRVASKLTPAQIAMPVVVELGYSDLGNPLGKAEPGVDYPDILPEETFKLPFGAAIVLRAPERRRRLRISAKTYPNELKFVEFVWKTSNWAWISDASSDGYKSVKNGFADIVFDVASIRGRMDIMVFPKYPTGMYGPPTIVSVYSMPNMRRYYARGRLVSIDYVNNPRETLYDISPIWIPHEWKDEFEMSPSGKIFTFKRTLPKELRGDLFSAIGELILSSSSSGYPIVTTKVQYYVCPETGVLKYREVGENIRYRLGTSPSRRSGE